MKSLYNIQLSSAPWEEVHSILYDAIDRILFYPIKPANGLTLGAIEKSLGLNKSEIIRILAKSGVLISAKNNYILRQKEVDLIVKAYVFAVKKAFSDFKKNKKSINAERKTELAEFLRLFKQFSDESSDDAVIELFEQTQPCDYEIERVIWNTISSTKTDTETKRGKKFKKAICKQIAKTGLLSKLHIKPIYITSHFYFISHRFYVFPDDEEIAKTNIGVFALHALN